MPRLRAARTKEEAQAVPPEEPIQIVLPDEPQPEEAIEAKEPAKKEARAPEPEPPAPPEPEPEPEPGPDVGALQKQIEALKRAEKTAQDQLLAERQRAEEALRRQDELRQESTRHSESAAQAQYDAILNALEASRIDAESAKREIRAAKLNGDAEAELEAIDRLASAKANAARLEDGRLAFEARREATKTAPPEPKKTEQPPNQFEAMIAQLPDPAKDWLRKHPEYMTDQRKNAKVQSLHWDVLDEGHQPFSQGYFESIETHLGLRQKAAASPEPAEPEPPRRTVVTQAPPTREVPSAVTGKPKSTRIELSPAQREAARIAGVDEITYARNLQLLEQRKREGHYQER